MKTKRFDWNQLVPPTHCRRPLDVRPDMRKLIAALLLTAIRSLPSGATCSAALPTREAGRAAISTMVREPPHNAGGSFIA
jgi:hypothetical protein